MEIVLSTKENVTRDQQLQIDYDRLQWAGSRPVHSLTKPHGRVFAPFEWPHLGDCFPGTARHFVDNSPTPALLARRNPQSRGIPNAVSLAFVVHEWFYHLNDLVVGIHHRVLQCFE